LESHVAHSEDVTSIQLRDLERRGLVSYRYPWSWGPENLLDWTLHLSNQIPISLEIETYAGESTLELGALQITDLKISVKASATHISLPDCEGHTTVSIEAITASLIIRVPPDVAVSIHNEIAMVMVEGDLVRFPIMEPERHYQSANYETAAKRVDIQISGDKASVEFV
jgi:predicted membrane protein